MGPNNNNMRILVSSLAGFISSSKSYLIQLQTNLLPTLLLQQQQEEIIG